MNCPHCEKEIETIYVAAPAVVETCQLVTADFGPRERASLLRDVKVDRDGSRYLPTFLLEDTLETLESHLDHHTLELDATDNNGNRSATFYCGECNGDLTADDFWAWAAEPVPA